MITLIVKYRYYSLKARLRNDRSIKVYRRERFNASNPIHLRQNWIIDNLLNQDFISLNLNENGDTDYSETNSEYVLNQQKIFNKLTTSDPHNIISWCNYAKFYDETVLLNRDIYNKNIKERKLNLNKQIEIYEKAVEHNPNSTILLLNKLNLYQLRNMGHSDEDINIFWQGIIEENPHNTKLWESYLYFQLTQNKNNICDEDEIYVIFEDAIRSLNNAKHKAYSTIKFHDGPDSEDLRSHIGSIERTLLNVFLLYCKYEWFAGYKQKCIALLQAIIEFNIFKPKENRNIIDNFRRNMVYFKLFWESDCCRIGENAAIGFDKFVELLLNSKKNDSDKQSLLSLFNQRKTACNSREKMAQTHFLSDMHGGIANHRQNRTKKFNDWMVHQCDNDLNSFLPRFDDSKCDTNTDQDDEDEDIDIDTDPNVDGVILFEDIDGFLFELNDIELQQELIINALDIIGIDKDLIGLSMNIFSNEILNETLHVENWEQFIDTKRRKNNALNKFLQFLGNDENNKSSNNDKYILQFAVNMLQSIHIHYSSIFPTENQKEKERDYVPLLCSMILITNKLKGSSECKELCKSLLQKDQFNLRLYNIYAQIEIKNNNIKDGIKVYKNALKMLNTVPVEQKCYGPMLFFEYLMIEIIHKNNHNFEDMIELMINVIQFKFNVIPKKKNKKKKNKNKTKKKVSYNEKDIETSNSKFITLLNHTDESFWKSPNNTLIKTKTCLFNSRSPSTYFFIFGFILKILTCGIQQSIDYVLYQLFKGYKGKNINNNKYEYIGNKYTNKSEIEFILYHILKIIEWYNNDKVSSIFNTDKYVIKLLKYSCKLYPTNAYFLSCIEMYSSNKFEIRCIYKSFLTNTNLLYASSLSVINIDCSSQLIVWIKYILFEIGNDLSSSSMMSIFNDALLIPSCRYNVAFWRLYLYYLLHQHYVQYDIEDKTELEMKFNNDDNDNNDNTLSRYHKQRLKRERQLRIDNKKRSIDGLKHIFEMSIQTISTSKMLYLCGLDVVNSYCNDNELNDYINFIHAKYLNFCSQTNLAM